jgi:hypothetical protein
VAPHEENEDSQSY